MNKESNIAQVISFQSKAFQNAEGEAIIKINGKKIRCFLDNYQTDIFVENKPSGQTKCMLSLMVLGIKKSESTKQEVISLWEPPGVNYYKITGKVIKKTGQRLVIDCGFFLNIHDAINIKVSEYIEAEGRIDMELA